MDSQSLAHAIDHARRSLSTAYERLVEAPSAMDEPLSPDRETLEQRIRAEAARVERLLETVSSRPSVAAIEEAADELDRGVAELDELIDSERDEA